MQTLTSLVQDVEVAVNGSDPRGRIAMLRRVTDLFSAEASRATPEAVGAFDEVMVRLAASAPVPARAELSERLAGLGLSPRKLVHDLAFDEAVDVARPVLERSACIEDVDLVRIAEARGQDHLLAISRRKTLSESVTDVLVTRGDQSVARSVASNDGARFSAYGFTTLTDRASGDEALEGTLRARADLPPAQIARLAEASRARIAARLARAEGSPQAGRPVVPNGQEATLAEAIGFVEGLATEDGLGYGEDDVAGWVREGRVLEAIVGVAREAGVPVAVALRAHRAAHYDPLLFLVRSVRYGWGTLKLLLATREGPPLSAESLRSAFEAFQALSVPTAQRVVRFTAVREQAQDASAA